VGVTKQMPRENHHKNRQDCRVAVAEKESWEPNGFANRPERSLVTHCVDDDFPTVESGSLNWCMSKEDGVYVASAVHENSGHCLWGESFDGVFENDVQGRGSCLLEMARSERNRTTQSANLCSHVKFSLGTFPHA
jgi:hypothetical protein